MTEGNDAARSRPQIHLSESDYDRIAGLALRMERGAPEFARLVLDEIERAQLHPDGALPGDVVAIGAEVEFVDDGAADARRVTLVMPAEADISAGRVSVMTSVGIGLIGLAAGQSIDWPCPDGRPRTLRIRSVRRGG